MTRTYTLACTYTHTKPHIAAPGDYLAIDLWGADDEMISAAEGAVIDQLAIELAQKSAFAEAHRRGEWVTDYQLAVAVDDLACLVDGTPDMLGRRVTLRTQKLERYAVARLRYELDAIMQQETAR